MIKTLENSPKVRKMLWAMLFIFAIYAISSLLHGIGAIKWW